METKRLAIFINIKNVSNELINSIKQEFKNQSYKIFVNFESGISREDGKVEWLPDERSEIYRNSIMSQLNIFFDLIESNKFFKRIFTCKNINLLEASRYEWFFSIIPASYEEWAINQILSLYHPNQVICYFDNSVSRNRQNRVIKECQIRYFNNSSPLKRPNNFRKNFIYRIFYETKQIFIQYLNRKRFSRPIDQKSDILFVENFPNSAKISISISKKIFDLTGKPPPIISTNESVIKNHNYQNLISINSFSNFSIFFTSLIQILELLFFSPVIFKSYFRIMGKYDRYTRNDIIIKSIKCLVRAILLTNLLNETLNFYKPTIVSSTSTLGIFSRSMALLSKTRNIKSFFIQHGLMYVEDYEKHIIHEKILTWGEYFKEKLVDAGFEQDNIFISGSPKFEKTTTSDLLNQSSISNSNKKIRITYFPSLTGGSTTSKELSEKMLKIVLEGVKENPNFELVIKLKNVDNIKIDPASNVIVINNQDASELLEKSDIVIVSTSTVGIEACLLEKPLILLNPLGVHLPKIYEQFNAGIEVTNAFELENILKHLIDSPENSDLLRENQKRLVDFALNSAKPNSLKKIADIILSGGKQNA